MSGGAAPVGGPMDEAQMRAAEVPWPETMDELTAYIEGLVEREHDYGTCVYAMSMAAVAAFQHVAKRLGVTGFQASCADMDVLRRTRNLDGPFMLVKGEDALYPQYDVPAKVASFLAEIQPWLAEQAAANLAKDREHVNPNVRAHWQKLARATGAAAVISPARRIEREDEDLRSLAGLIVVIVLYAAASYLLNGGI